MPRHHLERSMARSSNLNIQTPGTPPTADDLQEQAANEAAAADAEQKQDLTGGDDVAALKAKLAALEAKNAELTADLESKAKAAIVFEPQTPHGMERLAASATKDMTVAEVMKAIDDKRLTEPMTSYLCADGNYCRRS